MVWRVAFFRAAPRTTKGPTRRAPGARATWKPRCSEILEPEILEPERRGVPFGGIGDAPGRRGAPPALLAFDRPARRPVTLSAESFRRALVRLRASPSARGAGLSLALKIAASALNIVMLTVLARNMSVAEFGRFALAFNAVSFLAVLAGCGQERLVLRSWNEYLAAGRYDLARGALGFGLAVSVAVPLLLVLVLAPAAWLLPAAHAPVASAAVLLIVLTFYIFTIHVNRAVVGILASDGHEITWRVLVIAAVLALAAAGRIVEADTVLWLVSVGMAAALVSQTVTAYRWT